MREAIGGSMLYYIVIPILFLFIVFIAFIMNYASAYRAGNYIISQIETCDANVDNCSHISSGLTTINDNIRSMYHYSNGVKYCYIQNVKGTVYRVSLDVNFDLPLIGKIGVYKVVSESKTIYNVFEGTKSVFGNGIRQCNEKG